MINPDKKLEMLNELMKVLDKNYLTEEDFLFAIKALKEAYDRADQSIKDEIVTVRENLTSLRSKMKEDKEMDSAELEERMSVLQDSIQKVAQMKKKGDKGDKGDKGNKGGKGDDGEAADEALIQQRIEQNLPQLGTTFRDGLELLQNEERLDAKAIKNLPEFTQELGTKAGWGAHPLRVEQSGVMRTKLARTLNFKGTGAPTIVQKTDGVTDLDFSGGSPSGANGYVQYAKNGAFASEQGFEYDESTNTLQVYQDLGTELIENGDFSGDNNANLWNVGAGFTYANRAISHDGNGVAILIYNNYGLPFGIVGAWYQLKVTVSALTVGSFNISCGGQTFSISANGIYTFDYIATSQGGITVTPTNTSRFTVDDFSVRQKTGGCILASEIKLSKALETPIGGWGHSMAESRVSTFGTLNNLVVNSGHINFTSGSAKTLTGVVPILNITINKHIIIQNRGFGLLTIAHESASSTATNRFFLPGNTNYVIPVGQASHFSYDTGLQRWVLTNPRYFFDSSFSLSTSNVVSIDASVPSKWARTTTTFYPILDRKTIFNGGGVDDGSGASVQIYSASSCQGTATACATYNASPASCNAQAGCSHNANSCPSQGDQSSCDSVGCTWGGAFCSGNNGVANTCPTYTDETSCSAAGCGWDGTECSGDNGVANTCPNFNADESGCNSTTGCSYVNDSCQGNNESCGGTPTACSSYTVLGACNAQAGCSFLAADAINAQGNSTLEMLKIKGRLNYKTRVVTASGAVTITIEDRVVIVNKTTGAATTVNLPTPEAGDSYTIKDGRGDASTNNITVTPASGNIDGAGTSVMSTNYQSRTFIYNGTQWNVIT